ncbi:hypothetical protein [Kutzneria kofuensis]|uniref:hypothetical protein n=1 Tax=Kutzneria kofuensis TaxID=103725 RepID=UPI0031E5D92E
MARARWLVRSAKLGAALYRTQDPAQVEVQGDVVTGVGAVERPRQRGHRPELCRDVADRLDGGATEENVDMSGGRLSELDLGAGADRITAACHRRGTPCRCG